MTNSIPDFIERFEFQPGHTVNSLLRSTGFHPIYQKINSLDEFRSAWESRYLAAQANMSSQDNDSATRRLLELAEMVLGFIDETHSDTLHLFGVLDGRGLSLLSLLAEESTSRIALISLGHYAGRPEMRRDR